MIYGQSVGKIFSTPSYMGIWLQGQRTEPFFLWAYESSGEFKGNGIDIEGRFNVDGHINDEEIVFKKTYSEDGPNVKIGSTFIYSGKKVEGIDFVGGYNSGDKLLAAINPEGHFLLEKYKQSETLDYIVDNLDRDLLRRKR